MLHRSYDLTVHAAHCCTDFSRHGNSDYLPVLPNSVVKNGRHNLLDNFYVDTMLLDRIQSYVFVSTAMSFRSNGTGHYSDLRRLLPCLEAILRRSRPPRVPLVLHNSNRGASYAVYIDEVGETHIAHEFFVLALRHDPSDVVPPYPRPRKGAMDPTGPVYWLRFWPKGTLSITKTLGWLTIVSLSRSG